MTGRVALPGSVYQLLATPSDIRSALLYERRLSRAAILAALAGTVCEGVACALPLAFPAFSAELARLIHFPPALVSLLGVPSAVLALLTLATLLYGHCARVRNGVILAFFMSLYLVLQALTGSVVSVCLLATGGSVGLRLGRAAASCSSGACFAFCGLALFLRMRIEREQRETPTPTPLSASGATPLPTMPPLAAALGDSIPQLADQCSGQPAGVVMAARSGSGPGDIGVGVGVGVGIGALSPTSLPAARYSLVSPVLASIRSQTMTKQTGPGLHSASSGHPHIRQPSA